MTHPAVTDWLDRTQARADAATVGPWYEERERDGTEDGWEDTDYPTGKVWGGTDMLIGPNYDPDDAIVATCGRGPDAEFVAHARDATPRLVEAVRTVLDIADGLATTPATATQLATAARLQDAVYTALFDPPHTPGAPS